MDTGFVWKTSDAKSDLRVEGGPLMAILFEVIALIYAWFTEGVV